MTLPDPLTHEVRIRPGWDRMAEGFGVHGLEFRFILSGAAGAIVWVLNTGWVPGRPMGQSADLFPLAGAVSAHSPSKARDWWLGEDACDVLPGGRCWGDVGYTVGDRVLAAMVAGGHEAVWAELAALYAAWLGPEPDDSGSVPETHVSQEPGR